MKNKLILILLIFLTSCGYTPIYQDIKSSDFSINIISTNGNEEMNNLIKNELEIYFNKESKNKYDVSINTNYEKKIISKNTSGATSSYQLFVETNFSIIAKDKKNNFLFTEKINVENNPDSFAQKSYEDIIKRNFASSIKEKLIMKLSNYK
jgi:outer membrane lipopolysaccharide assembly protein LptE/RlpB